MKEEIKKIVPNNIWNVTRNLYFAFLRAPEYLTPKIQSTKYFDFDLFFNRGNSIIKRLRSEIIFEEELCKKLVENLKHDEKPIFLDVGANLGLISLYVVQHIPQVTIHAFEPGPKQSELLEKTIYENNLSSRIFLNKVALSDKTGKCTFYSHPNRDQAKDGLYDTKRGEKTVAIEVETKKLDVWWEESGRLHVDVIKMDTEGAELMILNGAEELLKHQKPVIFLEIEPSNLKVYPYNEVDIVQFLIKHGYTVSTLSGTKVYPDTIQNLTKNDDTFIAF